MKIAFSTLGCPKWDLDTICRRAVEYGYHGIDWRGLGEHLDITVSPAFTGDLKATAAKIRKAGIEVSGISSSIRLCDAASREANIEEAKRTIRVASALGAKTVRVFCSGDPSKTPKDELARQGADCMDAILCLPGAEKITWGIETHDHWVHTRELRKVLDRLPRPNVGVVWDIAHSPRLAGESPEEVIRAVGPRIVYTHIKDCVKEAANPAAEHDGWRYVLPGRGQIPLAQAIALLKSIGYDGWLVFEHEKRWIPALPEPEEAFPAFANWAKGLL